MLEPQAEDIRPDVFHEEHDLDGVGGRLKLFWEAREPVELIDLVELGLLKDNLLPC